MQKTITNKDILNLARSNIRKGEKLIKKIEDSIERTDKIMYWKSAKEKQLSHFPEWISKITRSVCGRVAKLIKTLSHSGRNNLPKTKPL